MRARGSSITLNKVFKVFGFESTDREENPGTVFYRASVQLAAILLPQYEEFGGPKPTLIPVGVDQHPYLLLARDSAEKKKFIPPSELLIKFLWGIDGKGKMAGSDPNSAVFLTEDPKQVEKRLKRAYTGGSPLAKFQREQGGIPEICPIYAIRMYHFEDDNKIGEDCLDGELLCGQCKTDGIDQVTTYLGEHQAKLDEARGRMNEYLLTTPIRSILE